MSVAKATSASLNPALESVDSAGAEESVPDMPAIPDIESSLSPHAARVRPPMTTKAVATRGLICKVSLQFPGCLSVLGLVDESGHHSGLGVVDVVAVRHPVAGVVGLELDV